MNPAKRLSPRLRKVADLACEGFSNKEIGAQMGITAGTVKLYMVSVFDAFHVTSRYGLMARRFHEKEQKWLDSGGTPSGAD